MDARRLTEGDLEGVLELTRAAQWNQTEDDWRRVLSLCACFGVEIDGRLAASGCVACYGKELAWIGMVLTLPEFRGRGCASTLMRASLDHALGEGIHAIKLDATAAGAPFYRKFGFEDECEVERWRCGSSPANPVDEGDTGEPDWDLDRAAFGADRGALLRSFPHAYFEAGGHAMYRPGFEAGHFGPCVARDGATARRLVSRAVSGPSYWDLFSAHHAAKGLAHEAGFAPSRRLLRMSYQGRDVESGQDPELVYALSGFEWG
jgi:GNAT superfamily N-acetyltransferase